MADVTPYFEHGTNLRDREAFTSVVNTNLGMTKRYFSSIECEIYFGDVLMDDMVSFDFSLQQAFLPIFGFNSFVANARVMGRKEISGTFAINFTEAGYINKVLNTIADSSYKTDMDNMSTICDEKSTPQFNKQFDILLGYGYYKVDGYETFNNTHQQLVGVEIVGVQTAVDVSGNPIMEVYQFVAKDLLNDNRSKDKKVTQLPAFKKFNDTDSPNSSDNGTRGGVSSADTHINQQPTGNKVLDQSFPNNGSPTPDKYGHNSGVAANSNNRQVVTVTEPGGVQTTVAGENVYTPKSNLGTFAGYGDSISSHRAGAMQPWNNDERQQSFATRDLHSIYKLCHRSDDSKLQQFRTYRSTHPETILYIADVDMSSSKLTISLTTESITAVNTFALEISEARIEFNDDRIINVPVLPLSIKRTSQNQVQLIYDFTKQYNNVYQRLWYHYTMTKQTTPYVCKLSFNVNSKQLKFNVTENLSIKK